MFKVAFSVALLSSLMSTAALAHTADVVVDGNDTTIEVEQLCQARESDLYLRHVGDDLNVKVVVTCPEADRLRAEALRLTRAFYRAHTVEPGSTTEILADLYADSIDRAGLTIDRDDQLAELERYNDSYNSLSFTLDTDSFNTSACHSEDNCVVRGTVGTSLQRVGSDDMSESSADFVLVLDLRNGKVTGECSVTAAAAALARGCDDFPFQ